jgi:hypothetical protein
MRLKEMTWRWDDDWIVISDNRIDVQFEWAPIIPQWIAPSLAPLDREDELEPEMVA